MDEKSPVVAYGVKTDVVDDDVDDDDVDDVDDDDVVVVVVTFDATIRWQSM